MTPAEKQLHARALLDSKGWQDIIAPELERRKRDADESLLTRRLSLEDAEANRKIREMVKEILAIPETLAALPADDV